MALSGTTLGQIGDTGNASVYGVALSRAPAANTVVIVDILNSDAAGTCSIPSSVSGAGLVFSLVTSTISFNPFTAGSQLGIQSVWRSMGATPDSSRISCAGMGTGANTGCAMIVTEYSGVSTSGTSGANAVGQFSHDSTTASLTLDINNGPTSANSTANGWHVCVARASATSGGSSDKFLVGGVGAYATPSFALASGWTTSSSATTQRWTFGDSVQCTSILVELVADNPAATGGGKAGYYHHYYSHVVVGAA